MNRNLKWAIIILVILVVVFLVYKFAFKKSNFIKGYAKSAGDWVAYMTVEYDKDYYTGSNSKGLPIFFKKDDVRLQESADKGGKTAFALKSMNIYELK
jgi:hypothetical protein